MHIHNPSAGNIEIGESLGLANYLVSFNRQVSSSVRDWTVVHTHMHIHTRTWLQLFWLLHSINYPLLTTCYRAYHHLPLMLWVLDWQTRPVQIGFCHSDWNSSRSESSHWALSDLWTEPWWSVVSTNLEWRLCVRHFSKTACQVSQGTSKEPWLKISTITSDRFHRQVCNLGENQKWLLMGFLQGPVRLRSIELPRQSCELPPQY